MSLTNSIRVLLSVGFLLSAAVLNLALFEDNGVIPPFGPKLMIGGAELNFVLSASICRYCVCDVHTASVTCNSERHMRLKVVSLPAWADTFRAHNLTLPELPRFAHHARLRHLRINFCALEHVDSNAFVPLPALETLDLTDNALKALPPTLLARATRLRHLDLSRNKFADLVAVNLNGVQLLDDLALGENPFGQSSLATPSLKWPNVRRLRLDNANVRLLNRTDIAFGVPGLNDDKTSYKLPTNIFDSLESIDLSDNTYLQLETDVLSSLINLSSLALRRVNSLPNDIFEWLAQPRTQLHRLDLNGAGFRTPLRLWQNFCGEQLAWLDISSMGLEDLKLSPNCGIQWLYADDNRLTRVEIAPRANGVLPLKTLHLDGNRLTHWPLDGCQESLTRRNDGVLRENFYEVIRSPITVGAQQKRRSRQHRKVWRQPVRTTRSTNFEFQALEILSLADNLIEDAILCAQLGALPALTHLSLAGNRIGAICADRADLRPDYSNLVLGSRDTMEIDDLLENELTQVGAKLLYLNVSGNLLRDLSTLPRLETLAVLDASNNAIVTLNLCTLLRRAPILQHLQLAHNRGLALHADCAPRDGAHLVDVELTDCALNYQPDLSALIRLSAVGMSRNQLRAIDAKRLPPCLLALDANENRVERMANFTDAQLLCLRRLRLARNSLRCSCAVQRFATVLRQEDEFYDHMEYYCFTSDGWQHPLSAFLDADAGRCTDGDMSGEEFDKRPQTRLLYFVGAATVFVAAAVVTIRFARFVIVYAGDLAPDYKPLARFKPPVSL